MTGLTILSADLPDQLGPSQVWALVGLAMMIGIYMIVVRPMMRRKKDPLERSAPFTSLSQQRGVERQMQNLLVELSEMARQITAQLDTRSTKLEVLMKEADRKIAALHAASNGGNGASESDNDPQGVQQVPPESQPRQLNSDPDPRHADVYALADQGRDASDIASQLNRPRGEVELILALRGKG